MLSTRVIYKQSNKKESEITWGEVEFSNPWTDNSNQTKCRKGVLNMDLETQKCCECDFSVETRAHPTLEPGSMFQVKAIQSVAAQAAIPHKNHENHKAAHPEAQQQLEDSDCYSLS